MVKINIMDTDKRARKVLLSVPNMECTKCVNLVSKALNIIDGIEDVKVKLKFKTVTVEYDSNKVSVDDIKLKLKEKGYNAMVMN